MELTGNADELLAQFSGDAELKRPELQGSQAPSHDPGQFWSTHRDQFSEIGTEFPHIAEAEDLAVLEWTSKATLAAGRAIEYAGVSLLTFDEGDRVSRFSTYYDTATFVVPST
jgi:ketosteroid isomerase-like protein